MATTDPNYAEELTRLTDTHERLLHREADLQEECARLRARVAELEELLVNEALGRLRRINPN